MDRFRGKYGSPTTDQLAFIGRGVSGLAVLEKVLQSVIARMSGSSGYLSSSITDGLNFAGKIDALARLIDINQKQVGVVPVALLERVDRFRRALDAARKVRNNFAHLVWFRDDDSKIVGFQLKSKPATKSSSDGVEYTNQSLEAECEIIENLVGEGIDLDELLIDYSREIFSRFDSP